MLSINSFTSTQNFNSAQLKAIRSYKEMKFNSFLRFKKSIKIQSIHLNYKRPEIPMKKRLSYFSAKGFKNYVSKSSNSRSNATNISWNKNCMKGFGDERLFNNGNVNINGLKSSKKQQNKANTVKIMARLFGPAIFEAHKLKVLFLGIKEDLHPAEALLPRKYTLTHSDITATLILSVAHEFNNAQFTGWYSRFQRDEVLAVWRTTSNGSIIKLTLHVHCHISGGHFLLNLIARLRFWIFRKELPVVLEAFRHGDRALFEKHPDLEQSMVWVHFHSNIDEYNRKECWGPLKHAAKVGAKKVGEAWHDVNKEIESMIEEIEHKWPMDVHSNEAGKQNFCFIPKPIFQEDKDKA